jgi:hypothetical protein
MPADGAFSTSGVAKYTIPGTTRTYTCALGSAISVVGEDAEIMRTQGWVGVQNAKMKYSGPTTNRPGSPGAVDSIIYQGQAYLDTTVNAVVIYGGPKTGWLNAATGASA